MEYDISLHSPGHFIPCANYLALSLCGLFKSGQEYNPLQNVLNHSWLLGESPQLEYDMGGVHPQWVAH